MPPVHTAADEVLDRLLAERPSLHGYALATPANWQLGDSLLRWLVAELPERARTLETGCGYSTIALAATSAHHTVVSPIEDEHERVRQWCAEQGIKTDHVRFVADISQHWLPEACEAGRLGDLDAVLIDGDHAYPIPGIDWYYTAGALRVGGLLAVDDVSIRACGHLRQFLQAEAGRWELLVTVDDAAVFRKLSDDVVEYTSWVNQPWNRQRLNPGRVVDLVRAKVRLRSRIRALRERKISPNK